VEAKAHYLVTGDKDLLVIKKITSCRIVDVKTFEEEMKI
jgi:predicted nucleic acid-binding protein